METFKEMTVCTMASSSNNQVSAAVIVCWYGIVKFKTTKFNCGGKLHLSQKLLPTKFSQYNYSICHKSLLTFMSNVSLYFTFLSKVTYSMGPVDRPMKSDFPCR